MEFITAEIRPSTLCLVNQHLTGRTLDIMFTKHRTDDTSATTFWVTGPFHSLADAMEAVRKEMDAYGYAAVRREAVPA